MTTMEKGEPIHAQFSMNCPKCNEDLSKFYKEELDKAREEGRQEERETWIHQKANQHDERIRQEERARIISLIDGMKEEEYIEERVNYVLEAIKNKINV